MILIHSSKSQFRRPETLDGSLNIIFRYLTIGSTVLFGLAIFLFMSTALASPQYVQGNYAVPQTPQTGVTVAYTSAQTSGNLNIVVVGWSNSTSHVTAVKDSEGNFYQLAVGPTVGNGSSQVIYYAKSIAAASAGSNAVTVNFDALAAYPDIRILEYGGLDPVNPLDAAVGATGSGTTSASSTLTTSSPSDLLVAANTVQTGTAGAGSGFTQRLLTNPDLDIVQDQVVTATGTYSASAPLSTPGGWVMQLAAFRSASGTPDPTPTPTPTPTTPAYIQGNYAVPQTPQTNVMVPFTSNQSAGDLNVVIVGWNDSTSQVSTVKDSMGNTYLLAVGPMVTGAVSQSIYYAKNIRGTSAGTNVVTVTFSSAATNPDIRVLEYTGIDLANPMDAVGGSTGNSSTSNSGTVTTANPTDLLVAANTVQTYTIGTDTGYTQRLLTNPDGDLVEDRVVTAASSYSASPSLGQAGSWVMQMVAFKAAAGLPAPTPTPTPAPTPTASPTPTPTPSPTPTPTPAPTPTPTATPTPAPTPTYVQGNYAVPQTPQSTVTVSYSTAQTSGDLNVVVVGWNDSSAQVSSVKDSQGNVYQLAAGPITTGTVSQSIYYAANISEAAAGANSVTIRFGTAATSPDIRILEYNGINTVSALDGAVGGIGNGTTSSTGNLQTKNPADLLVAANTVETSTNGTSSGFTQRMLTQPDGDIAEDRVVTSTGSYSAVVPLAGAGAYVMQIAAFKAASSQTPPRASSVTLAWDADAQTGDPATNPVGYRLYYGIASGSYSQVIDLGNTTTAAVSNLNSGTTYYFVTKAYNNANAESSPSNEVSFAAP
jgi:hypothetical protein